MLLLNYRCRYLYYLYIFLINNSNLAVKNKIWHISDIVYTFKKLENLLY